MVTLPGNSSRRRGAHAKFVAVFVSLYFLAMVLYYISLKRVNSFVGATSQLNLANDIYTPGDVPLLAQGTIRSAQRFLCSHRAQAERTIIAHLHIQKSGGTAFALALKSECICNEARNSRPQKGYCRACPHVLEDETLPPTELRQNQWTFKNETFQPDYANNCPRYDASARWFGFQKRNRTYQFYSLNRLTTGWPCGVHVGYARLRMCTNRLKLRGVRHTIATLFREPLARYVSEFYQSTYNRIHINSWDWCLHPEKPIPFDDYLQLNIKYPFQNRVTKMLSGSPTQASAAGADWNDPLLRKEAYSRARGVLQSTEDFIFGLAERLDETLDLFSFVFRRSFIAPLPCHAHQNSTGTKCEKVSVGLHDRDGRTFELTEEQVKNFHANNWEDIRIYDEATKIFNVRMQALHELRSLGTDYAIDEKCRQLLNEPENAADD